MKLTKATTDLICELEYIIGAAIIETLERLESKFGLDFNELTKSKK